MNIEAVIFDWAGTTVDFGSFAPVQAFIRAFEEFGITPTVAEVREPMGMLKWKHIEAMMHMPRIAAAWQAVHGRACSKENIDQVYKASETAILKILHDFAQPKPYVLETIATLRKAGIRIGSTTGYTDSMMAIVVPRAKELGYDPDFWCSPNAVQNQGRPYPYMIFKNLEALGVSDVRRAVKVGDTVADIKEGKQAGLISVGIVEGSSIMGLSEAEWDALSPKQKAQASARVHAVYQNCEADYVLENMAQLPALLETLNAE